MSRYNPDFKNVDYIYKSIDGWKDSFIKSESLLFGKNVKYSISNVNELIDNFVNNPDDSENNFWNKLEKQVSVCSDESKYILAELLWLLFLFPYRGNMKPETKRERIIFVSSWGSVPLKADDIYLLDNVLEGIGSTGRAFSSYRWRELQSLILLIKDLLDMDVTKKIETLSNANKFIKWFEGFEFIEKCQIRHILPFLLFPDRFERIASITHKQLIYARYGKLELKDVKKLSIRVIDELLFKIRKDFELENETDIDFYQNDIQIQWNPVLVKGVVEKQLRLLKPGLSIGSGANEYILIKMSKEQITLEKVKNNTTRQIPVIVINKILEGIDKGIITLEQVLRNKSDNEQHLFDIIGFNYDKYILGYDATIHKICEYCINGVDFAVVNKQIKFNILVFEDSLKASQLKITESLPSRFISSLLTKPFVILTGLSGSGKTKLAEAFSMWICESSTQYCMVSVGADWTNREPLLGYPNALNTSEYVKPDNGVLDVIINASEHPSKPFFLILDEMNMSHVERYFADFLSAMESTNREIKLHSKEELGGIPGVIKLPRNLFIIGTVNIDETTYMFSPKVLDRANVIEFRVSADEIKSFFDKPTGLDLTQLEGLGASMGEDFVSRAVNPIKSDESSKKLDESSKKLDENTKKSLFSIFKELQKVGAEFGYRTASEISRFVTICKDISGDEMSPYDIIDSAIVQKLLPKLHGSRNKLEDVLKALGRCCLVDVKQEPFFKDDNGNVKNPVKYKISYEKLERMYHRVIKDGFTSFAEA